ncbi:MAG: peptidyl-prolyl cis-trans isomerase [Synergistaceae bacterium]|jgi:peptidyl-prolyl cis-trans isomerase C|nr:peptidyl-prolyl cis-trans isomerase [Synergistaceae bacterium]
MKRGAALAILAVLFLCAWSFPLQGAEKNIALVGEDAVTEDDMLFMISANAGEEGDGLKTGLALVQMGDGERLEMANQLADEILLSLAAKEMGLDREPGAAKMLKWQEIRALAGLYLAYASKSWDIGEDAARNYFESHRDEFAQAEAVKMRYLALPDGSDANSLSMDISKSLDLGSIAGKHGLPPDSPVLAESEWLERGLVGRDFDEALFSSDAVGVLPPLNSGGSLYIIEITDRRPKRMLSWEESSQEAAQRLGRSMLRQEIEKLRLKHPVSVDRMALSDIGKPN